MTGSRHEPPGGGKQNHAAMQETALAVIERDFFALEVIRMTPRQAKYVQHRAAGLGQERAALEAGYAEKSAKVSASRMERDPKIKGAIQSAREAAQEGAGGAPEFEDAQSYLTAVVQGVALADPVRVGAARALLPFERARQRAPKKSATPRQMQAADASALEKDLLDQWAGKAAAVRKRMGRP